jgi:4-aminobutyrate aminotransferase-like enzyme
MWSKNFFKNNDTRDGMKQLMESYMATARSLRARGVTSASPGGHLSQETEKLLERFKEVRGAGLVFPYIGSGKGYGPLVELTDGSIKYDMIGGIGVNYFGHGHEKIVEASLEAAFSDTVMQGHLQQNEESLEVMELFVECANLHGAKLDHTMLTTSGVMAVENGLKIAFQNKFPADRVLAFSNCFHGRTIAAASITDKAQYRDGLPQGLNVDYIPFNPKLALKHLKKQIARRPGKHACMIMELVQGEGGFNVGTKQMFTEIAECLKENNILLFADEVQTFARTYKPFIFQHFGLDEYVDLVSVGKSTQVCATLFRDEIKPRPGLVSQTFTGSTASLFAARVILKEVLKGDFYDKGKKLGLNHKYFNKFKKELSKLEQVSNIGGIGGMIAFQVYDGSMETTIKFMHELFNCGVIAFIAGKDPVKIRFLVPVPAMNPGDKSGYPKNDLSEIMNVVKRAFRDYDRKTDKKD